MPEPLRYQFRVGCPVERAFELWTARAGVWWPMATHSVSGRRDSVLVIEPGPGGRIYERTAEGREFSWGTVLAWEPARRLVCEWLVGDTPTELEVRFAADGEGGTVVEIEHRGWDRFGQACGDGRDRADPAMDAGQATAVGPGDDAGLSTMAVNGRPARYRDTGEGSPVLLIHGLGRSLEDWDEQHDLLSGQYRVISVDLPGCGASRRLSVPTTLASLARFVEDFLDGLEIDEPVRVAGNSVGGAVAMQFAAQAPARVSSLLLVSSAGFGRNATMALRLLCIRPRAVGRFLLRPHRSTAARVERSLFCDRASATLARVERALRLASRPENADVMLETLNSLGSLRGTFPGWRRELLKAVAALNLPTLVVWGERDKILPAAHLDTARTAFPFARVHLFPATGHMPQIERADEFAKLALDFWAGPAAPHEGRQQPAATA